VFGDAVKKKTKGFLPDVFGLKALNEKKKHTHLKIQSNKGEIDKNDRTKGKKDKQREQKGRREGRLSRKVAFQFLSCFIIPSFCFIDIYTEVHGCQMYLSCLWSHLTLPTLPCYPHASIQMFFFLRTFYRHFYDTKNYERYIYVFHTPGTSHYYLCFQFVSSSATLRPN
jgi:hypothetical protein